MPSGPSLGQHPEVCSEVPHLVALKKRPWDAGLLPKIVHSGCMVPHRRSQAQWTAHHPGIGENGCDGGGVVAGVARDAAFSAKRASPARTSPSASSNRR